MVHGQGCEGQTVQWGLCQDVRLEGRACLESTALCGAAGRVLFAPGRNLAFKWGKRMGGCAAPKEVKPSSRWGGGVEGCSLSLPMSFN